MWRCFLQRIDFHLQLLKAQQHTSKIRQNFAKTAKNSEKKAEAQNKQTAYHARGTPASTENTAASVAPGIVFGEGQKFRRPAQPKLSGTPSQRHAAV